VADRRRGDRARPAAAPPRALSRRGEWHDLLAATFATTLLAVGMLLIAALVEVFVSPHVIVWLRP
jgi:uncharacterized membrane protein SpoIIM required for sporulation